MVGNIIGILVALLLIGGIIYKICRKDYVAPGVDYDPPTESEPEEILGES